MLHRILSLSTSLSPHLLSSPSPRLQGMEFVEGEFGGGFGPETAAGDEFFVDEFLDFSNECSEIEESPPQLPEPSITCSVSLEKQAATVAPPPSLSTEDDFGSLHEEAESLESLEWLSHFVEDSFSDYSLAGKFPLKPAENRSETAAEVKEQPCFTTPVQTKARTKRARTSLRVWPVLSPSSSSSSSSTSSTTSFYPSLTGESVKKPKSKPADGGGGGAGLPRRCSHCGVTKTPQWRAGPLGSKTLCNACGVRFKSGRLLPEYRPACSPTFSSEMHSNNHRKVLEMRRKKEVETGVTGLPLPVQSF